MPLPKYAAKRDKIEPDIIKALEFVGATVEQLSKRDVADLLVGFRGVNYLLEVKSGAAGRVSDGQQNWQDSWRGMVAVVRSVDEALEVLGLEVFK